jgi:hypothetical protein
MVLFIYFINFISTFKLPARSPIGKKVADFGYPDWRALPENPISFTPSPVFPQPAIPMQRDVTVIKTTLRLQSDIGLPFVRKNRVKWTEKERSAALKAIIPDSMDQFKTMVCFILYYILYYSKQYYAAKLHLL